MNSRHSTYNAASQYAKSLAKQGNTVSLKRDGEGWIVTVAGTSEKQVCKTESVSISVGKFPKTGAVVVFDSSVIVNGVDNIYGYVPARDLMRQFEPQQTKHALPVSGSEENIALSNYLSWKQKNGTKFIASEIERLESKKSAAIQKHKEYLEKIGKPYSGVNTTTSKRHRATHCYACKESLDSDFHIECNECGWLICECGACGCGYDA